MSDGLRWNREAPFHSTSDIWALVTFAAERGVDPTHCVMGTNLDIGTLLQRQVRTSFDQEQTVTRRVASLLTGPTWPLEAAGRLHLTTYGIVGYALLSSRTLPAALLLTQRFGSLLCLKHTLHLESRAGSALLRLKKGYEIAGDLAPHCELFELRKVLNLLGDMLGDSFRPLEIRLPDALRKGLPDTVDGMLGGVVRPGGSEIEIHFGAQWLNQVFPQYDALTCADCTRLCDRELEVAARCNKTSWRVRGLIENRLCALPSMTTVAAALFMSHRSLRRRLDAEGTTFNRLVCSARREMAERMLATTDKSADHIAGLLGYSEVTNFRHAFKRWTGMSPRQYRLGSRRLGSATTPAHTATEVNEMTAIQLVVATEPSEDFSPFVN